MLHKNSNELCSDIYHMNVSYLILCQKIIREDESSAKFRLGIPTKVLSRIKRLTLPQLLKLASINQLICKFRFDEENTLDILTKDSRVEVLQSMHVNILLTSASLESPGDLP